jgi:hypothetical protein
MKCEERGVCRGTIAYNLWQVEGIGADGVEDQVLQLVDSREQILAESSHGDRGEEVVIIVMLVEDRGKESP